MSDRRRRVLVAALLLVSYAYVLPRWADWSQNSRLNLVRALSEERTVVIDRYVANTGDYAIYRGHAYSDKAPGPAFLALPAALALEPMLDTPAVQQQIGRLATSGALSGTLNAEGSGIQRDKVRALVLLVVAALWAAALPTALGALALWSLVRRLGISDAAALLVTLAHGLATTIAVYAGNFYSHALVAALLLAAWALGAAPYAAARGVAVGLLLGWAVISEYPAALPGLLIGLATVWGWRRRAALVWLGLGALPPLLLLALYDWTAFGTPLPIGYAHSALWQEQHHTGFLSLTWPHAEALFGLTFGTYRGLFVRSPWLLLAIPGLALWWRNGRDRHLWLVALLAPLSMLLVYGSSAMWWGGFAAGPRYIVAAIPFLAVASAPAAEWLWRRWWGRALALLAVLVSAALTWSEAVARQGFPPDSIADPWLGYTLPAWRDGDIARNLGTALGLGGGISLLPLAVAVGGGIVILYLANHRASRPRTMPNVGEGSSIASIQR